MFWEACGMYIGYLKNLIKEKYDVRYIHISLLFVLHIVALIYLPFIAGIVWTVLWIAFVPMFAGWYLTEYKPKNKKQIDG